MDFVLTVMCCSASDATPAEAEGATPSEATGATPGETAHVTPGDDTPSIGGGVPVASDGVSAPGDDVPPAHGDDFSAPGDMSQPVLTAHMICYLRPPIIHGEIW